MHRFREPVNGFTHLTGAIFSAIALLVLVTVTRGDPVKLFSVIVYGFSLIILYAASATYHLSYGSERKLLWLERIDHAAIYILIAGCYTPFCLIVIEGEWRWILLATVWALALIGVVYKLLFLTSPGMLSLLYYIVMASVVFIAPPEVIAMIPPPAVVFLVASGVVFFIGSLVFGFEKPNLHRLLGYHELWHLFVLTGSALHFIAILYCLQ
ncbi:MAG: hemolysin III family protein [Chloroflexi bacterium]|nr:hemolysin III family protein [Chloroflexota bacterium]MCC6892505.1 hemolysin III family protein [Anaerolineae bacterium]